jgi:subtilisin family serine protease
MRALVPLLAVGLVLASCEPASRNDSPEAEAPRPPVKSFVAGTRLLKSDKAVPGRYIVVLDEKASATAHVGSLVEQLSALHGASVERVYSHALRGFSARMSEADALRLSNDPLVRYVEEDAEFTVSAAQFNPPWGVDRIDQRHLPLDQRFYYGSGSTGAGVNAYVIDTGIRITHSEFGYGARAQHAFSSVEDGWNADDCHGHGTHVAGTLGGSSYGVAKEVTLHAVRVADCSGNGTTSSVIAGVDWVTANHVKPAVANMSLGLPAVQALDDAVTASINAGVFYVVSAGNDNVDACSQSPARVPAVVTVGATTQQDARASFSNYGGCVDLFAPGETIFSAWVYSNTNVRTLSGTSMAAPHVAGAAARYLQGHPQATPEQLTTRLLGNATPDKISNPGAGSPNKLLYTSCMGSNTTPPQVALTAPLAGSTLSGTVTLSATATDDEELIRVDFLLDGRVIASSTGAPYQVTWNSANVSNGAGVITARAYDDSCNEAVSAPASVTVQNTGNATFDAARGLAACLEVGSRCDSTWLLEGRGSVGPEPHQPNTVGGSCADGTEGIYRTAPSLERLVISRGDGTPFAAGKEVTVEATVYAGGTQGHEALDLYVSPDVSNPTWTHVATMQPSSSGRRVLGTKYLLPAGERHLLRAAYRPGQGNAPACVPGPLNDHDDMIIAVGVEPDPTPPTVSIYSPSEGMTVEGVVTVGVYAHDNFGVHRVELYAGESLVATNDRWPFSLSWASRAVPNGAQVLTVRVYDLAGNVTVSAPRNVVVNNDHTPPQVSFLSPVNGATVEQTLSLQTNATDDRGVARVDFYVDGTLIGSRTYSPFNLSWNARTVPNGPHVLSAVALDAAGNLSPMSSVNVTVNNDLVPPQTAITSPASGATVRGDVYIQATASDDRQVARVAFLVDGFWIGDDTTPPYSWQFETEEVLNGSHTLTTRAYDAAGLSTVSAPVTIVTDNPNVAHIDSTLHVPRCDRFAAGCDTLHLIRGRGGYEASPPSALGGCLDSSSGAGPDSLTIDRLSVSTYTSTPLSVGKRAYIDVRMNSVNGGPYTGETLDLYYAADANQPVWTYLASHRPSEPGSSFFSTTYILPPGGMQAVRAVFRARGSAASCITGTTVDHDDLIFAVDNVAPTATITTPASGVTVTGLVNVTATASDNDSVTEVELYDGHTLVGRSSSPPYQWTWNSQSGPNGSRSLTVRAYDKAGNVGSSQPVTVTAQNDVTPPTVSMTSPAPGATLVGTVELSANATDDRGISRVDYYSDYQWIGASATPPFRYMWNTVNVTAGQRTLTAKATDLSGNETTSAPVVVTVARDTTPPVVSITAPAAGSTLVGTVTISASATDELGVTKVEFFVNGALLGTDSTSPYSVSWSARSVANGSYTLTARATDTYGNVATSAAVNVTVDNDTTLPIVSITSPANGATVQGTAVLIQVEATDNTSVSSVELLVDGVVSSTDSSAPYSFSWNSSAVPNGTHTLSARARDSQGNVGTSAPITVTVDNDSTAPSVAITSPASGASVEGTVSIQAEASDERGVTRVEFFRNGTLLGSDTTAPYGMNWDSRSVWRGTHTLTAKAYDAANNVATSAAVTVTVDNAPTVVLTAPASGGLVGIWATVSASATDDGAVARVEFYADGALIGTDTSSPYSVSWNTATLPSGAHTLTAKAYDNGGRVGTSAELVVNTDSTPPGVALTSPAQGMHVRGTVTLEATASDNQAVDSVHFEANTLWLGTDSTSPYTKQWDTTGLEGAYTLKALAYDRAGNLATSAGVQVIVDNTAPTVAFSAPAQSALLRGTVQVTATASDNQAISRVEFYDDTTLVGTATTAPYSVNWDTTASPSGSRTLWAKAYDLAGNVQQVSRAVTVDNSAPTVAITSPASGAKIGLSVTIQASASDNLTVTQVVFYDGAKVIGTDTTAPYSVSWSTLLQPKGQHTLTARAHDSAGNVTTSAGVVVTVQ